MKTLMPFPEPPSIAISTDERDAVTRYIAAIVAHDSDGSEAVDAVERTRALWAEFMTAYANVATGPYALRGHAAMRLALGRL